MKAFPGAVPGAVPGLGLWVGTVRYIDFDSDEVLYRWAFLPALYKRNAFEHERELRAVNQRIFLTKEAPLGEYQPVDLNTLVENVYIAPGAPPWFGDTRKKVVDRYSSNTVIQQSKLDAQPLE
jgi:hypothetical protein